MAGTPIKRAKKKAAAERRAEREANGGKRTVRNPTPPAKKAAKKEAAIAATKAGEELDFADFTTATWDIFINEYLRTGRQDRACKKSGIPRQTVYRRTRQDVEFAKIMEEARELCMLSLEDEAIRRARDGWLEPQFGREGFMGEVRKYDSGLLQFMLMHGRPDKYRPKKDVELTVNPASQPPVIHVTLNRPATEGEDNG